MAVNINAGAQRHESNANENFDEIADQNTQQDPNAPSQLSQQSGSNADSPTVSEPAVPLSAEEAPPAPVFARYGPGDTVITGAPNYARAYLQPSSARKETPEPIESPFERAQMLPMPKPAGNGTPTIQPATQPSLPPATDYASLFVPGNAGWESEFGDIGGETLYQPALPARNATQLTEANVYAEAHGLSAQDAAKLAALMANNHSPGREWLSLRPEVLASVLDAIKANPDGSFDVSRVFGGA